MAERMEATTTSSWLDIDSPVVSVWPSGSMVTKFLGTDNRGFKVNSMSYFIEAKMKVKARPGTTQFRTSTFKKQTWSCMSASRLSSMLFQRSCTNSCSKLWTCPSTWLPKEVSWVLRSSPTWVPVRFTVVTSSGNKSVHSCCRACTNAWECAERLKKVHRGDQRWGNHEWRKGNNAMNTATGKRRSPDKTGDLVQKFV